MEYIVLGVQSWELEDEKTHKMKDGISIHYLDPSSPSEEEDSVGIFPAKLTAKTSLKDSFTTLPGRYIFDIGLKRTGGGKTGVELNSVKYVGSVNLTTTSKRNLPQTEAVKEADKIANKTVTKTSF